MVHARVDPTADGSVISLATGRGAVSGSGQKFSVVNPLAYSGFHAVAPRDLELPFATLGRLAGVYDRPLPCPGSGWDRPEGGGPS